MGNGRDRRLRGRRLVLIGGLERGGQLEPLHGVVGGAEHLVRQLPDVLDQALALVPEQPGVDDDLLGVLVGVPLDDLGLALGALEPPVGLCPGTRGDLVRRLVGALENAGGLLAELVERLLDNALSRLTRLEVGHEIPQLLEELVDRPPVVSAHGRGKADVPQ